MIELVFATFNENKAREIGTMIGGQIRILTLQDIGHEKDIPETGNTFEENASIKSGYIAAHFGKNCFADDSGLEVECLNGAPGIYSARYAGDAKNDQENMILLLANMKNCRNRQARFISAISLRYNGNEYIFKGELKGMITNEPIGTNGFGYDPVFVPDGYSNTMAELTLDEKNSISHRAIAFNKLKKFLAGKIS
jgi:XTP/dITP diphosphohydrolase